MDQKMASDITAGVGKAVGATCHDATKITPEILEGYAKPPRAENWDEALREIVVLSRPLELEKRLDEVQVPASGDHWR